MFGDGLWMKELKTFEPKNTETYLKYAAICAIYGKTEEAIHSLELIGEDTPSKFKRILIEQLKKQNKERRSFNLLKRIWNL